MPGLVEPFPTYWPYLTLISAITNAPNAQVTTSEVHNYQTGLIVRILVPDQQFGMLQINQQVGSITVVDSMNFTIDIDTTLYTPFVYPGSLSPSTNQYPSAVPIGEVNSQLYQATRNVLGSY